MIEDYEIKTIQANSPWCIIKGWEERVRERQAENECWDRGRGFDRYEPEVLQDSVLYQTIAWKIDI